MNDLHHFDAIIVGTGQAGRALPKRLADAELSVAVIERHLFGDTCVNTADAMSAKAPYPVLERTMHIHPTVSELMPTLLGELRPSRLARH